MHPHAREVPVRGPGGGYGPSGWREKHPRAREGRDAGWPVPWLPPVSSPATATATSPALRPRRRPTGHRRAADSSTVHFRPRRRARQSCTGSDGDQICGRYSTSCPSSSSQPWELSAKCAGVGMPDSVTVTVVRTPASDPGSGRDSAWAPTRVVGFLIRLVAPAPGDQRGFPNHLHPDGERIVEVSAPIERVWRAVSDADDTSANHCAISAAPDEDSVATGFQLPGRRRSG